MSLGDTITATTPTPDVVWTKIASPNPLESVFTTYDSTYKLSQTIKVTQSKSKTRKRTTVRLDWSRAPGTAPNLGTVPATASVYFVVDSPANGDDVGYTATDLDYMLHGLLLDAFGTTLTQKAIAGQI
jgi:hypothetical protein